MSCKEAEKYLIENGYKPGEIAGLGVFMTRRLALLVKIKLTAYKETRAMDRIIEIKAMFQEFEKDES